MARKWYGSLQNRLEENKMFTDEITVGTGMTEYFYSDRKAYEVTEVTDQKHIKVRRYDVKRADDYGMSDAQTWTLISNPENGESMMTKRGNYWYWTVVITADMVRNLDEDNLTAEDLDLILFLAHNNTNKAEVMEKGKVTRYHKATVSFGIADYYYDYSF